MAFNRSRNAQNGSRQAVQEPPAESSGNAPVHTVSLPAGKGAQIQASIFENQVQNGEDSFTAYSVTVVRRYRDGEGWKTAKGFRTSDLLLVSKAAEMAYEAIMDEG